jgi:large subunit ribosomal protein L22
MSQHKYAHQGYNPELHVRAVGRSLPISTKVSVEICNFLRKRQLQNVKEILERVIKKDQAIPYKRFNMDVGHKPGKIASGRYPKKASTEILNIMKNVEANAQMKGFNTNNLEVIHLCAHKASRPWHHGRQRRQLMKRTHIEVVVAESAKIAKPTIETKKDKTEKKETKAVKQEAKQPAETKEQPKKEVKETKVEAKLSEGKQELPDKEVRSTKTSEAEKASVEEKSE